MFKIFSKSKMSSTRTFVNSVKIPLLLPQVHRPSVRLIYKRNEFKFLSNRHHFYPLTDIDYLTGNTAHQSKLRHINTILQEAEEQHLLSKAIEAEKKYKEIMNLCKKQSEAVFKGLVVVAEEYTKRGFSVGPMAIIEALIASNNNQLAYDNYKIMAKINLYKLRSDLAKNKVPFQKFAYNIFKQLADEHFIYSKAEEHYDTNIFIGILQNYSQLITYATFLHEKKFILKYMQLINEICLLLDNEPASKLWASFAMRCQLAISYYYLNENAKALAELNKLHASLKKFNTNIQDSLSQNLIHACLTFNNYQLSDPTTRNIGLLETAQRSLVEAMGTDNPVYAAIKDLYKNEQDSKPVLRI